MTALSKFLVLLAIFLLANLGDAFINLSSAAGNLVRVNHLIRLQQPMSDPTNEPSCIPTGEPTKRTELPSILSTKSKLIFTFEKMNGSCQQLTHAADSEGVTLAALHLPGHKYVGIQQMSSLKSFDGDSILTNYNPAKHDSANRHFYAEYHHCKTNTNP